MSHQPVRWRALWLTSSVAGVLALLLYLSPGSGGEPAAPEHPLIVHEWGTFTSFSGADGVQLDFRPLVDNDLPAFVYSDQNLDIFGKRRIYARQRMETPVTYFYSDIEREVQVSVKFPNGRLTEFYPPTLPSKEQIQFFELPPPRDMLDWGTVHLIPESKLVTQVETEKVATRLNRHISSALIPWTDADNHYYEARKTDSALLYVRREDTEGQIRSLPAQDFQGDHFEKFLFYRGTGTFELPVRVESLGEDRVRIRNEGPHELRAVFLVENGPQGFRSRFVDRVKPESMTEAALRPLDEPVGQDLNADVIPQLVSELVSAGLYEKEATAMVRTWQSAWFNEPGLRVFFIVPEEITNALLPLSIEPKPDEMVRILVARMELMSPEEERSLEAMIDRSAADPATHQAALMTLLKKRGRLAEPALQRVASLTTSDAVKAEAERIRDLLLKKG